MRLVVGGILAAVVFMSVTTTAKADNSNCLVLNAVVQNILQDPPADLACDGSSADKQLIAKQLKEIKGTLSKKLQKDAAFKKFFSSLGCSAPTLINDIVTSALSQACGDTPPDDSPDPGAN